MVVSICKVLATTTVLRALATELLLDAASCRGFQIYFMVPNLHQYQ